jgi:hypothetical protein
VAERGSRRNWLLPLRGLSLVVLFLVMALAGGLLMFAITQVVIRSFGQGLPPLLQQQGTSGHNR